MHHRKKGTIGVLILLIGAAMWIPFSMSTTNESASVEEDLESDYISMTTRGALSCFYENIGQLSDGSVQFYGITAGGSISFQASSVRFSSGRNGKTSLEFESDKSVSPIGAGIINQENNFILGDRGTFIGARAYKYVVYPELWSGVSLVFELTEVGIDHFFLLRSFDLIDRINVHSDTNQMIPVTDVSTDIIAENLPLPHAVVGYCKLAFDSIILDSLFGLQQAPDSNDTIPITQTTIFEGEDSECVYSVAKSESGDIFVAGKTWSPMVEVMAIEENDTFGESDIFVIRMNEEQNDIRYLTIIGGMNKDSVSSMEIDFDDSAVLVGSTNSIDFPLVSSVQNQYGGGLSDSFILRLNNQGNSILFSTFLGHEGDEYIEDLCLDTLGTIYITGYTSSQQFPTTTTTEKDFHGGLFDCFVATLSRGGVLQHSVLIGGSRADHGVSIALGVDRSIYVTGYTFSENFPVVNAFDHTYNGGSDCFVIRLNPFDYTIKFSSFIGGTWTERPTSIAVDVLGNAYITGSVFSTDFPVINAINSTNNGNSDVFIFKIASNGTKLHYSTFLGGSADDLGSSIVVDIHGYAYVCGYSESEDFPLVNHFDVSPNELENAFLLKLNPDGKEILFSTLLGQFGTQSFAMGLSIDSFGTAYVSGCFQMSAGPENYDAFIMSVLDFSDSDNDNLEDYLENQLGTLRFNNDSDGDTLADGYEYLVLGTDPLNNDSDADTISDGLEVTFYRTDPNNNDSDLDSLLDGYEVFVVGSRPLNNDSDGDFLNDGLEWNVYLTNPSNGDSDNDSLLDGLEVYIFSTLPTDNDTDSDGIDDATEVLTYFTKGNSSDSDSDTISDFDEIFVYGSSPLSQDTDSDTLLDNEELYFYHTNLTDADTDQDMVSDADEVNIHFTNPLQLDSENDTMPDGWEILYGLNPLINDSLGDPDSDLIPNVYEFTNGSSPITNDTDSDSLNDYDEIHLYLTNPSSVDSDGDLLPDADEIYVHLTLPNATDTDNDLMDDGWEILYGLNPLANDSAADLDIDSLLNLNEYLLGTLPNNTDSDGDTLLDNDEVTIHGTNPAKMDSDSDGINDNKELGTTDPNNPDSDNDTLSDGDERSIYDTDPTSNDTDLDNMPDGWEVLYGLNPSEGDNATDLDLDGISNLWEYLYGISPISNDSDSDTLADLDEILIFGTDPGDNDTDGDLMSDDWEILYGLDQNNPGGTADGDLDGLNDLEEFQWGTIPTLNDTDADAITDGMEVNIYGTSPVDYDSDGDLLDDGSEITEYFTEVLNPDTDSDSMYDGWEVLYGLNPKDDSDAVYDQDSDGLWNAEEFTYHSNPNRTDSDNDTLSDAAEVFIFRTLPNSTDSDHDGMQDNWEVLYELDPLLDDSGLDADNDTLTNLEEFNSKANPLQSDSDEDLLSDAEEVLYYFSDPRLKDSDMDGIGDFEEATIYHTNLTSIDTDMDEMPDPWEIDFGLDPAFFSASNDDDLDGITDLEEYQVESYPNATDSDNDLLSDFNELREYGTDPSTNDTDSDQLDDYEEIFTYNTDPLNRDSDGDTKRDGYEVRFHFTDPLNPDTDSDQMMDGWELDHGLDPLVDDRALDHDFDFLTNFEEYLIGSNPSSKDSDGDSLLDEFEVKVIGTSPMYADTDGDLVPDDWEYENGFDPRVRDSGLDQDGDSLSNRREYLLGTNPNSIDSDMDSIDDGSEVLLYLTNPLHTDSDRDGLPDVAEINQYGTRGDLFDSDFDGIGDGREILEYETDPLSNDSDADELPDYWEILYGTNPMLDDATQDLDGDTLSNLAEYEVGSNPSLIDSDADSLNDATELYETGTNPAHPDSDMDSMPDAWELTNLLNPLVDDGREDLDEDALSNALEFLYGTDPNLVDTDGDTLTDAEEILTYNTNATVVDSDADTLDDASEILEHGTNPLSSDSDMDSLDDATEIALGTNPLASDSDHDGIGDLWEVQNGFDPLNPDVPVVQLITYNIVPIILIGVSLIIIVILILKRAYIQSATLSLYGRIRG
jgi:hypothetical protein